MFRLAGIRLQSGALPYRVDADGSVRVLLVETGRGRRWSIPKGAAEPHLSLAENAAKEAFEEAGVVGEVAPRPAGKFRATKQLPLGEAVIEVCVFLLRVTEQRDDWPEKGRRRVRWLACEEAARLLREPLLRDLCRQLAAEPVGVPPQGSGAERPAVAAAADLG